MNDTIECPECKGIGYWLPAFPPKYLLDKLPLSCYVCEGNKFISKERQTWIDKGKLLKAKRHETKETVHVYAKRLELPLESYIYAENGRIDPSEFVKQML